jgi:phosphoserine phosphatase RsbU/P
MFAPTISKESQSGRSSAGSQRELDLELKVGALQKDYAELHAAVFEAAQVHRRLCAPRLVQRGDFEIASEVFAVRHLPADIFIIQETVGNLIIGLADICGHGLAAGMWTTHFAGLLRRHASLTSEPNEILTGLNNDLRLMAPDAPLTSLFLGRLDTQTGDLIYSSGGHPPPMLLRASGDLELLTDGGPLLGVIDDAGFVRGKVRLTSGDLLLAYSDGIPEAQNRADEEFGYGRLELELRHASRKPSDDILFSLLGTVQDFAAGHPQSDDMSLVVVRRK